MRITTKIRMMCKKHSVMVDINDVNSYVITLFEKNDSTNMKVFAGTSFGSAVQEAFKSLKKNKAKK